MRGHNFLIGQYLPRNSWLHRTPYLLKLLAMAAIGAFSYLLPVFWPPGWLPLLILLALILLCYPSAKLPLRTLLSPLKLLWLILLFLVGYQLWAKGFVDGWPVAANLALVLLSCVYAAALLSLTTPVQAVLDGLSTLVRPFRRLGVDQEKFALTVSMMFRSIPYLIGAYADVHEAAKARGLDRSIRAHALPTVVATVALAQSTGEALAARGLGD